MPERSGFSAFTLLEVLIVLAIIAALVFGSMQGWRFLQEREQEMVVTNELQRVLMLAKQSAMAKQEQVSVCAVRQEMGCGEDWSKGILIFFDPDNRGQPEEGKIFARLAAFPKGQKLTWHGWLQHAWLRFEKDGLPHSYHGTFYLGAPGKEQAIVVINAVGRIRLAT